MVHKLHNIFFTLKSIKEFNIKFRIIEKLEIFLQNERNSNYKLGQLLY